MTPWAFVQEELPSEDIPYILEVEEPVVSWHEIEGTSIVDIAIKSFEEDVLKLQKGHYYSFLNKDGAKNPEAFRSWYSQVGLEKRSNFLRGNPSLISFNFHFLFFLVTFEFVYS